MRFLPSKLMSHIPRTPTKRGAVIGLMQSGLTPTQIAKQLGWPRSTVRYTIDRHNATGSSYDRARSGRPRLTKPRAERVIIRSIKSTNRRTWEYFSRCHQLSKGTLRRIAKRHGIKKRIARRKPFINKKNREKRMVWARENEEQDWTRVLFTDEASFELTGGQSRRTWVLRRDGEAYLPQNVQPIFRSGRQSIMVWGAIGFNRKFDLHFFEPGQRITSHVYLEEILPQLKRYARLFKGRVSEKLLLQLISLQSNARILCVEDNAPVHNSRRSCTARAALGINRLDHPPSSPDCNPIEAMWREVKRRLSLLPRSTTLEGLKETIKEEWSAIHMDFVNNLIWRQERVVEAVIQAKGIYTPY